MHICPRCVTPLSNFEVTQGYIDVLDWSVIWQFPVKNQENTYILTWTTTPWSTPGTVAIAIEPITLISRLTLKVNIIFLLRND